MSVASVPRLKVFISADLEAMGEERAVAHDAVARMRFQPLLSGAPGVDESECHVFVGVYGAGETASSVAQLEASYRRCGNQPRLIYVRSGIDRPESLATFVRHIQEDDQASYKPFGTVDELSTLIQNDLALILSERYEARVARPRLGEPNLPRPLTSIVGRERERGELLDMVGREDVRLITVVGAGGIGKTRLVLDVAARVERDFRDGVFFVPLGPVTDPNNVVPAVAKVLGIRVGLENPLETISNHLSQQEVLMVLDNFEHLASAAGVVAELLSTTGRLKVVVTSRATLSIRGEHSYDLAPLSVPDPHEGPIADSAAVELFVARAREVHPRLELTEVELRNIAEICRRLDGLPLAIELAAARCRVLSPSAILERLTGSTDLLRATARDVPDRQKTLRDTIEWSYRLLDENEARLFARLSLYPSAFTVEGAEAIAPDRSMDAMSIVGSLLDKSLVRRVRVGRSFAWFEMLETVRQFGLEKLEEMGETEDAYRKHSDFVSRIVAKGALEVRGPRQTEWMERTEFGMDNIRLMLGWCKNKRPDVFVDAVRNLAFFWEVRGYLREGRRWTEDALQISAGSGAMEAELHRLAGRLARAQGDLDDAMGHHEQGLARARAVGARVLEAFLLKDLGVVALERGDFDEARSLHEEALTIARATEDKICIAEILNNLGVIARFQQEPQMSKTYVEESLELFGSIDDRQGTARALMNLGTALRGLSRFDEAIELYKKSLKEWREVGGRWMIAEVMEHIGLILAYRQETESAARLLGAADNLRVSIGAPWSGSERDLMIEYTTKVKEELQRMGRTELWDEGRGMRLDDAIELALAV